MSDTSDYVYVDLPFTPTVSYKERMGFLFSQFLKDQKRLFEVEELKVKVGYPRLLDPFLLEYKEGDL